MKTRVDIKILGAESASIKTALATYLKDLGYSCQCGADTITALKKQEIEIPEIPVQSEPVRKPFGKK